MNQLSSARSALREWALPVFLWLLLLIVFAPPAWIQTVSGQIEGCGVIR